MSGSCGVVLKPGEVAPKSGQYVEQTPDGTFLDEATIVKGHIMPPTNGFV